jgi:hypothetical protein
MSQLAAFWARLTARARGLFCSIDDVLQGVVTLCALVTVGLVIYVVADIYTTPPALRFDRTDVRPNQDSYCPGDTLRYPFAFTITHGPVLIGHRQTLWNIDHPGTDAFDLIIEWAIYKQDERVDQTRAYVLPVHLSPGRHELRIASSETARGTAYLFIPFTVRDDCP